ncbi:MAG: glycine oxidase ThiO [Pseudomonadales bacterium]|nr:glycine oxidase ThiO [Pseudomonadales bacterium]
MSDVIIVGGGIIGLLSARELLQAGAKVTLIDKSEVGTEASWAGGGIVSPLYPWQYQDPISDLVRWAQAYYPNLSDQLREETGVDPQFNPCGLFMLDSQEHEMALWWAQRLNAHLREVDVAHAYEKVPALNRRFKRALSLPAVGNIRNPRLLKALRLSLLSDKKFTLIEGQQVNHVVLHEKKLIGVATSNGEFHSDAVLLAAGAWTPLLSDELELCLKIEPVRGEMLVFEPCPGLLPSIVLHEGKYLIPRLDGRIVVGSTIDRVGYDKSTTLNGREALMNAALDILPELESLKVEKHWAGLRPGSPAGLPYMGESSKLNGLFVCAGHYRNGLVTAPASARLMTNLILKQKPEIDPLPFSLDRETNLEEMI